MIEYTVKVWEFVGIREWYLNGKLHREDGPAVEYSDGTKEWYVNGKRHRENGPAIEWADGDKYWYLNGKRHREDGPAIEKSSDGTKRWYLNGVELTTFQSLLRTWYFGIIKLIPEKFLKKTKKTPSCAGKIVEIEGVQYKLMEISK